MIIVMKCRYDDINSNNNCHYDDNNNKKNHGHYVYSNYSNTVL